MQSTRLQAVLLDMGGVILRMAGGHGFPHSRLDWRGRQAMLQAMGKGTRKVTLEDLESLVFGPWRAAYDRREETGIEAAAFRTLAEAQAWFDSERNDEGE